MKKSFIIFITMALGLFLQAEEIPEPFIPAGTPESVDMPFRITSLLRGSEGDYKIGLVNDANGDWKTLSPGDTFLGQRLLSVHYDEEYAEFDKDGDIIRMYLWGGNIKQEQPTQSIPLPNHPGVEIKLNPKPTTYTQTAKELAGGINPNDPETWPEDYRGPAIERLTESVERQNALFKPEKPLNFEPTKDEIARGIDPNDATTWPKDYRGPGIERAAKNQPVQKSNTPFVIGPKPEGTPEEIKQRFLDLHTRPPDSVEEE